jgi:hypothetical protein
MRHGDVQHAAEPGVCRLDDAPRLRVGRNVQRRFVQLRADRYQLQFWVLGRKLQRRSVRRRFVHESAGSIVPVQQHAP